MAHCSSSPVSCASPRRATSTAPPISR
ncbi:hypothetical protein R2601_04513 [Salipiger bermudensis HTCC2601]|uniref:Uncharacterized protein n=1 Tax=Salipiger bermudensis (strain DSM 26914 / JCM 13377 / KCTC 12554 / HTCC2601) TaxID=314265 RepID=Q0FVU3_SALBH|nr:hypothetical protein R2601_04513 [Salipiger bermudensis HTCC2601]